MAGIRRVGDWIAGRYEVFAVSAGGMGLVYAVHDHLGAAGRRTIALKTLRDEFLADRDRAARFATECRLWIQLGRHPNIVRGLAVEDLDGRPFVLLELVTGGDLRRWIGTPRLDAPRALRFGVHLCLGMEHAARARVRCHRDLKPGNLLVSDDGTLKVTDFGLAKVRDDILAALPGEPIPFDDEVAPGPPVGVDGLGSGLPVAGAPQEVLSGEARPPEADDARYLGTTRPWSSGAGAPTEGMIPPRTRTDALLGTAPYMAPEQFRDARAVDHRADIYAAGVVLFEMLAGEPPFRGPGLARLRRQHERYEPPPLAARLPRSCGRHAAAIDRIVGRCLRKDPDERFTSFAELRRALSEVLRRLDPRFDPRRP